MIRIIRPDTVYSDPNLALCPDLERQMLAILDRRAPDRIEALAMDEGAPTDLADLLAATSRDANASRGGTLRTLGGAVAGQRIPVWSGASGRTIWSSPEVNYLFRAWRDWTHILLGAGMDPEGERRVALEQQRQIQFASERARNVLWAETQGQARYHQTYGRFPVNQRAFVADAVGNRGGIQQAIEAYADSEGSR